MTGVRRITVTDLQAMRERGERITMLTAYDYSTAKIADEAGIPVLLVGDSLGMVVLGYESTLPVTVDDMVRHGAAVVRGAQRAHVVQFYRANVHQRPALKVGLCRFVERRGSMADFTGRCCTSDGT